MSKRIIYFLLCLLLLADLSYSFVQHLNQPLDGDMAWNIVPSNEVKPIFDNPLGTDVIVKNLRYPNPNRFFCHWSMKEYFLNVPLFLQKFAEPIDSIYLSCAIAKIIIQIILIFFLTVAITGTLNLFKMDFLIVAVLITPLFQTNGFRDYMGIIDQSPSYTFFYALPCAFLLIYFSPFILQYYHNKKLSAQILINIFWIPFALIISLSGPLNPGIVLIFALFVFFKKIKNSFFQFNQLGFFKKIGNSILSIPKGYWFYLLPISLFSLYSLYIGHFNSYNVIIPLSKLYSRLPEGVYYQFTQKLGFPILLGSLLFNAIIIFKNLNTIEGEKILKTFKWVGIFAFLYIVLLPFGGYRIYRPNVLRYDTIMPITLSLIFIFGISTFFILKTTSNKQKTWYVPIVAVILVIFTVTNQRTTSCMIDG